MAVNHKQLAGRTGEDAAVSFVRKLGYQVISRNFRVRNGEIDIICLDESEGKGKKATLVFIEVKTRLSQQFGTPFEAITPWKMQALVRTAEVFKMTNRNLPEGMRIDAISVMLDQQKQVIEIEHLKSIT
ncbi:hypothetical protein BH11PAT1_BH11PAT1_0890 [soil metagenome]